MARAIVPAALRVAVIYPRVKPFARGIFKLLVSHGAKRDAAHNGFLPFAHCVLLFAQNGVVFFAADVGALKPHELVVFRSVNDHLCLMNRVNGYYIYAIFFCVDIQPIILI